MGKGPAQSASAPRIENRKASHHYEILDRWEAGIELSGSEVKSLRSGKASIDEAFAHIRGGEAYLRGCNIQPYENAGYAQHVPTRERRLLLHRREIQKILGKITQKGLTLIPLRLYFSDRGWVKIQLGLCRGKKLHDKRSDMKSRDAAREMSRAMRRKG